MSISDEQEILVNYNGKIVKCTKDQLIIAAANGQVTPDTQVQIGSNHFLAQQLSWLTFPNIPPQVPASLTPNQAQPNQFPPPGQYQQPQFPQPTPYQQPQFPQPTPYQQPNPYQQLNPYQQPVQTQVFPVGRFCPACGNPLVQTATVCPKCGSAVGKKRSGSRSGGSEEGNISRKHML